MSTTAKVAAVLVATAVVLHWLTAGASVITR